MPLGRRKKITTLELPSKPTENTYVDLKDLVESSNLSASVSNHNRDIEDERVNSLKTCDIQDLCEINVESSAKSDVEILPTQTAIRSSSRVSKPPRRETYSPPPSPIKKQCKASVSKDVKCSLPRTKRAWELWSADDKHTFFEGLCEYGKDFEAIQNLISQKYKKKGADMKMIKNKEQVRHLYYRTWHKIAEYAPLRDPAVKKRVQELYGLINYGELRKKIRGTLNEKGGKKLSELIHTGVTTIKVRGKNIRIRTPVCKALKKINKIDDLKESSTCCQSRVPDKVLLELTPKDNETWSYIQSLAQNPRLRLSLKPETKLAPIIMFLERKWRPVDIKKKDHLVNSGQENLCVIRLFAHRECEVTPVSVMAAKQEPPPQLHFDNYLKTILGINRDLKKLEVSEVEKAGNSENSLSGHEGTAATSSPDVRQMDVDPPVGACDENIRADKQINPTPVSSHISIHAASQSLQRLNNMVEPFDDNAMFPEEFASQTSGIEKSSYSNNNEASCYDVNKNHTDVTTSPSTKPKLVDFDNSEMVNKSQAENESKMPGSGDDGDQDSSTEVQENLKIDREVILKHFRTGWLKDDCSDISLAELYVMFGKSESLRLEYSEDSHCSRNTRPLSQLILAASSQFAELTSKTKSAAEKTTTALCNKCSMPLVGKSTTKKPNKLPQNVSECREAVFRVPTQPVKAVPIGQTDPSSIYSPIEKKATDPLLQPKVRPFRKQVLVPRRLLPKAPVMMTYSVRPSTPITPTHSTTDVEALIQSAIPKPVPSSQFTLNSIISSSLVTSPSISRTESILPTSSSQQRTDIPAAPSSVSLTDNSQRVFHHSSTISPTNLSSLFDMSLHGPSQITELSNDTFIDVALGNSNSTFSDLIINNDNDLLDSQMSGSDKDKVNFKLNIDQQWLNGEVGDISLGTILSESPVKHSSSVTSHVPLINIFSDNSRDFLSKHDIDSHIHSIMNESSADLVSKFADIAARLANENN